MLALLAICPALTVTRSPQVALREARPLGRRVPTPLERVRMSAAFEVTLAKPLGLVLEERDVEGVKVAALQAGGAASLSGEIAPGDVLIRVGDKDVSSASFDAVMDTLINAPAEVSLTLSDGLGRFDVTPNLGKSLKTEDAVLADLVVRAAVREVRKITGEQEEVLKELGDLLRVEILVGAGVRPDGRCLVRFFGIFSTGAGGSYSCNVSATGRRSADGEIEITALSCAKDEYEQTVVEPVLVVMTFAHGFAYLHLLVSHASQRLGANDRLAARGRGLGSAVRNCAVEWLRATDSLLFLPSGQHVGSQVHVVVRFGIVVLGFFCAHTFR